MEAPEPLVVARVPSVVVPVRVVSKCVYTSVVKCVLKSAHSVGERRCVKGTACVRKMARVGEIASMSEKVGVDGTPGVSETPCVDEAACVSEIASVSEKVCVTETPSMKETPGVEETPSVKGTACVSKRVCVSGRPCVSGTTCVSEMARVSERPCVRETACVRSLCAREMAVGMREHATACPGVGVMSRCVSIVARRCAWVEWRRRRHQTKKDKGRVAAVAISSTTPGLHGSEREVQAVLRTRPPRAQLRE